MDAFNTSRQTHPRRIGRITAGLALALVTVSMLSLVSASRADDPPADPGGTGAPGIKIDYFGAQYLGNDKWFVEGIVEADDMSAVSIQFGGCTTATTTPEAFGYFTITVRSYPNDTITADATFGTETAHAEFIFPEPMP